MKLFFLGTSGALATAERSNTFYYVEAGSQKILVDCAGNPAGNLLRCGCDPSHLHLVLLTHLHVDHCYGLPALLFHMFLDDRSKDLAVAAPDDAYPELEIQLSAYRLEPDIRTFNLNKIRIPADELTQVWQADECRITASSAEHSRPCRAYRIDDLTTGKSIVFSGDTRPTPSVRNLARNATLLVHEATYLEEKSDLAANYGHSTATEAAQLAREADVDTLCLVHFDLKEGNLPSDFKDEAARTFSGEIIIPDDMTTLEI
jgi:ribonuclease Z